MKIIDDNNYLSSKRMCLIRVLTNRTRVQNIKSQIGQIKIIINLQRQTTNQMSEKGCPNKSEFYELKQKVLNEIKPSQLNYNIDKSESSKKNYIPNKQYTNKYLRTSSVYEEKQNQKMIHLNRLFTFIRRNQVIQKFRAKRLMNCRTEPNQIAQQTNDHLLIHKNQLKVRVRNNTSFEKLVQPRSTKDLRDKNHEIKDSKGISFTSNVLQNINSNEKISTSRALQKYARLIKQNIFQSSKSHNYQKSLIYKQKSQHYSSNIQTKQMILCQKDTNCIEQRRVGKKYLFRKQIPLGDINYQAQQDYNINGWETTS